MSWLKTLLAWLTPSQEAKESAVWTSMWVEGYTDDEIELAILEMRKDV